MKPTFDHVLVATDFSASASAAIDYAATLASRAGARLHLVHVLEEPFVTPGHTNGICRIRPLAGRAGINKRSPGCRRTQRQWVTR